MFLWRIVQIAIPGKQNIHRSWSFSWKCWRWKRAVLDRIKKQRWTSGLVATQLSQNVGDGLKFRSEPTAPGCCFLFTASSCKIPKLAQLYALPPRESPEYFMIASWPDEENIYVFSDSHYYCNFEEQGKRVFVNTFQMDSFDLSPFSELVGNGYVQRAETEFLGHPNLHYYV